MGENCAVRRLAHHLGAKNSRSARLSMPGLNTAFPLGWSPIRKLLSSPKPNNVPDQTNQRTHIRPENSKSSLKTARRE